MWRIFRIYRYTLELPIAIVLGWDLEKTKRWSTTERTKEIMEDLFLTLFWPITGPGAIKRAYLLGGPLSEEEIFGKREALKRKNEGRTGKI